MVVFWAFVYLQLVKVAKIAMETNFRFACLATSGPPPGPIRKQRFPSTLSEHHRLCVNLEKYVNFLTGSRQRTVVQLGPGSQNLPPSGH